MKELANILDKRMRQHATGALMGALCVLGTITANGVKLDDFKHEITDPLYAEWNVKLQLPGFFLLGTETCMPAEGPVGVGASVDSSGALLPGAGTRGLTKYTFASDQIVDQVKLELKPDLQAGDRVLVIPINGGQDCVILCKVVT